MAIEYKVVLHHGDEIYAELDHPFIEAPSKGSEFYCDRERYRVQRVEPGSGTHQAGLVVAYRV